ncbi:MAG: SDR family oxidoreductase [Gammaproteobacteria bacterium]|nr:SDR family oxidoreductase [Gammaproteobacteria bacterium]
MRGRTALITGASAGIGRAFAAEYARRGANVVLTARRTDRLEALARELEHAHGIVARTLAADLAVPGAPAALCEFTARQGVDIDVVVNNAGYGLSGTYLSRDWAAQARVLQLMLVAVAELTHRLLPGMRARGYGRVINVASLAGHLPATAGHTLYIPIKAWLLRFSEALALEYGADGVHVCALCPGFTGSEFHDVAGTRAQVARLPGYLWMSAERVAREGVEAVERGQPVHIPGRVNRAIALVMRILPPALARRLMARHGRDFRKLD